MLKEINYKPTPETGIKINKLCQTSIKLRYDIPQEASLSEYKMRFLHGYSLEKITTNSEMLWNRTKEHE